MTLIRGMITGVVIGVILSVVLNSWAFMAVGIAFGAILGGMPLLGGRPNTGAPERTTPRADKRSVRRGDDERSVRRGDDEGTTRGADERTTRGGDERTTRGGDEPEVPRDDVT